MSQHWFVKTKQGEVGPYTPSKLRQFVAAGKLKPTSIVRRSDTHDWVHASRIEGLFTSTQGREVSEHSGQQTSQTTDAVAVPPSSRQPDTKDVVNEPLATGSASLSPPHEKGKRRVKHAGSFSRLRITLFIMLSVIIGVTGYLVGREHVRYQQRQVLVALDQAVKSEQKLARDAQDKADELQITINHNVEQLANLLAELKATQTENAQLQELQEYVGRIDRSAAAAAATQQRQEDQRRRDLAVAAKRQLEEAYLLLTNKEKDQIERIRADLRRGVRLGGVGDDMPFIIGRGSPFLRQEYLDLAKAQNPQNESLLDDLELEGNLRDDFYFLSRTRQSEIRGYTKEMFYTPDQFVKNDIRVEFARNNRFMRERFLKMLRERRANR